MKMTVKPPVLFALFTLLSTLSFAQIRLAPPSALSGDLKKIIADYPQQFASVIGEPVQENTQSIQYTCRLNVHGAEESSITRYSSDARPVYSWEALMLTTDDFDKAKQKFRSLFTQLNNMQVKIGQAGFTLRGEYQSPKEEMKFTSVVFDFHPGQEAVDKLKVEVAMHYELTEWKVRLLVYDREREDDERGAREDGE
jgi:hypothetical protein